MPEITYRVMNFLKRKGRVCAGNPGGVSCAIYIDRFQSFFKF